MEGVGRREMEGGQGDRGRREEMERERRREGIEQSRKVRSYHSINLLYSYSK